MERDMRDPSSLGNALLAMKTSQKKSILAVADDVDRGILGRFLIHPAFLNGRSSERLPATWDWLDSVTNSR